MSYELKRLDRYEVELAEKKQFKIHKLEREIEKIK